MSDPVHAVDWIRQHGTRHRQIGATELRNKLKREKGTCTWCGKPVGKGRQTWCNDECVKDFKMRCDPGYVVDFVYQRDQGFCSECRQPLEPIVRQVDLLSYLPHQLRGEIRNLLVREGYCGRGGGFGGVWRPYHIDHTVPVSEGGGLCGPAGLRLLCLCCHKTVTAAWRAKKGRKKK